MNASLKNEQAQLTTILLLDCQSSVLTELPQLLENEGFQCMITNDIKLSNQYLSQQSIDILIIGKRDNVCDEITSLRESISGYLPVLLICDELTDQELDQLSAAEVDAVIFRPINFRFLLLKLLASLRIRHLYQLEIQQKQRLLQYWQKVDQEQEIAAKVFSNILKSCFLETEAVKAVISPMSLFNGDLVLVSRTPENHLHVLLGDFTGHGLSASIAATPTAEIFSGMTQKGFSITDIVTEINLKLKKMLPTNMFLAATVAAIKPDEKKLSMITCGLPEHFLVDHKTKTCITIDSLNLPLGIQSDIEITEQVFNLNGEECLFLLTDGMFEAENNEGKQFGKQRIIDAIINAEDANDMQNLQASLQSHCGQLHQKDDIAFVKLICHVDNVPWQDLGPKQTKRHVEAMVWKSMMEFDISTLRVLNPVPSMVNTLMDIQGLQAYRQNIFIIINELFANALDHGLLELDSSIKSTPEGFMAFYALKEQRLQNCFKGHIRFVFSHEPTEQGGQLTIKVRDTGKGFNQHHLPELLQSNIGYCGRGIKLVSALCSNVTFQDKGNQVTAVYDWQT